jgi:hypothetical protein
MTQKELQLITMAHLFSNPWFVLIFTILTVWAIIWKGIALWKAARDSSKVWFIIFLIVNTLGILEIIYIFYFFKKKNKPTA